MATGRIESGRVDIRAPGSVPMQRVSVPEVNFVAPRVEAQGSAQLAEALDRMSANLFQDAMASRQREGLQFAAENPLTPEQIEAAKNGDLSTLDLGSNPVGVFSQAVRKARSLELSSRFEAEGRNELVTLLNQVELGQATSEQVQTKINTMIDGMGRSLAKVDAEAAYKFRATMATHGNAVLKSALDAEVKRAQNQALTTFDANFDNATILLEKAASDDPENFDFHASVYTTNVTRAALRFNNPQIQAQYSEKARLAIRNAKINAVTKELLLDPNNTDALAILNQIKTGQAGGKSKLLQGMIASDFEAVAKIEANVMTAVNHRNSVIREQQAQAKAAAVKEFIPLYERAVAAPEGSALRRQLAGQISAIAQRQPDAVPLSVIKDLFEPNKEGNPVAEFNTLRGIYEGRITSPDQIWNAPGLTSKQKVALLKTLTSEDRRDGVQREAIYSRLAGIQVIPGQVTVLDPKGIEFQRRQELKSRGLQLQAEFAAKGEVLTPQREEEELSRWLNGRRNTEAAKAARRTLDETYSRRYGGIQITRENLPALRQKAGNDQNKLRELNRIEQLLNTAEGN